MTKKSIITRKQAGVIYRSVKEGALSMSKKAIGSMYDLAGIDASEYEHADSLAEGIERLLLAVDAIFSGDTEAAQGELDAFSALYA